MSKRNPNAVKRVVTYCRACSGAGWLTAKQRCGCEAGNFPPMVHYRAHHIHVH